MSLLWRDYLSVGNNVIDADHKYLIDIINRVEHSFRTKSGSEFASTFGDLSQYSRAHFDREERIANAVGYKNVSHLNQSHQELLNQLDLIRGEIEAMEQEWTSPEFKYFTDFLQDWLINHVIREDLLMKHILQKHPPDFNPG